MCILNRCHRCVYIIFIDTYIHPHVHIHDVYNGAEQQKKKKYNINKQGTLWLKSDTFVCNDLVWNA